MPASAEQLEEIRSRPRSPQQVHGHRAIYSRADMEPWMIELCQRRAWGGKKAAIKILAKDYGYSESAMGALLRKPVFKTVIKEEEARQHEKQKNDPYENQIRETQEEGLAGLRTMMKEAVKTVCDPETTPSEQVNIFNSDLVKAFATLISKSEYEDTPPPTQAPALTFIAADAGYNPVLNEALGRETPVLEHKP